MRKLLLLFLVCGSVYGQQRIRGGLEATGDVNFEGSRSIRLPGLATAPVGACAPDNKIVRVGLKLYICDSTTHTWAANTAGSATGDLAVYYKTATQLAMSCTPGNCGVRVGSYTSQQSDFPSAIDITCPGTCTLGMTIFFGFDMTTSPATCVIGYDGSTGMVLSTGAGSGCSYKNTVTGWENFDAQNGADVYPLWTWTVTTPTTFDATGGVDSRMLAFFTKILIGASGCLTKDVANGSITLDVSSACLSGGGGTNAFADLTAGTNSGAGTFTIGTGSTWTFSGSGILNANRFKGNAIVAVADGGFATGTPTSGGVPYAPSNSTIAWTPALAPRLLVGGGAGNPPVAIAGAGATTDVLHGSTNVFAPVNLATEVGTSKVAGANVHQDVLYGGEDHCIDSGSTDTYACSLPHTPSGYVSGHHYFVKVNTGNTGAASWNNTSLGAKAIKKMISGSLIDPATGDICAGQELVLMYDGTVLQMLNAVCNPPGGGASAPGSDKEIVINTSGNFATDSTFTFDQTTKTLSVNNLEIASNGPGFVTHHRFGGVAGCIAFEGANSGTTTVCPGDAVSPALTWPIVAGAIITNGVATLSSLTSVGTIVTGTWNATAIDSTHGGTAQTSWTKGDLLGASAANTLGKLAVGGTNGQALIVDSTATYGFKWGVPTGSQVIYQKQTSPLTLTTSTNTTVFTASIPGGTMASGGCMNIEASMKHTSGSASTTYGLSYGGSTNYTIVATTLTAAPLNLTLRICNDPSSTSSQQIWLLHGTGTNNGWSQTPTTAAIDSTASQTLLLTANPGANASEQITPYSLLVTRINP